MPTSGITNVTSVNCTANLSSTGTLNSTSEYGYVEWWTLIQSSEPIVSTNDTGTLELYVYSEQVAPPVFNAISGIGFVSTD